jgi:hypothetical protein
VNGSHHSSKAGTRKLRLILHAGIKLARRLPEQAERPLAASVIPNARCHDTMLTRSARHLTKSHDGVCHKVNDELCQGGVKGLISKRQLLRTSASHADPGVALELLQRRVLKDRRPTRRPVPAV